MTRLEFTINIVGLLKSMIDMGEHPVIDYVKRSPQEQKRLFDAKLSKCDGIHDHSGHEYGKAVDIYFPDVDDVDKDMDKNELLPPKLGWKYWHDLWANWGGQPEISWDRSHFEG